MRVRDLLQIDNQSLAGKIVKGSLGSFVLSLISTLLSFLLSIMLARVLGANEYGVYAYAISWMTLLSVFARLGLDTLIPRHVASAVAREDWGYIKGIFHFGIVGTGLAASICLVGLWFVGFTLQTASDIRFDSLWLAFILLGVTGLMAPLSGVQRGLQQVIWAQIPSLLVLPLSFLSLVAAAYYYFQDGLSAESILRLQILATIITLGVAVAIFVWYVPREIRIAKSIYEATAWANSLLPLVVTGSAYVLNMNADILLLGALVGTESAGIYKAATRGADLVILGISMINMPLAPIIASLYAKGEMERLQRGVTKTARVGFLLSLPVAICMFFFGHLFLRLFGEEFQTGVVALSILSIGQIINAATGPVGWLLTMTGNEKKAALGISIGVIFNIVFCLFLIPAYGLVGAACATSISTVIWNLMLVYYVRGCLGIDSTIIGMATTVRA